jgi:carbonic anhydrase
MGWSDPLSRRQWLARAGASSLAPLALAGEPLYAQPPAPQTPDDALRLLVEGNQRFAQGRVTNPHRTLARLQELGSAQAPFAAVLACADSRVPVEILFDQGFGDLFVARVAGNLATSEIIGSLEYAAEVLGSKLVVVLGHAACGAVKAAMEQTVVPGQIGSLYPYIRPAVESAHDQGTDAVIAQNVRNQVDILKNASPVVAARIRSGALAVAGGVLNFRTGLVQMIEPARAGA